MPGHARGHLYRGKIAPAGAVDSGWDSLYKFGVKGYEVQTMLNPLNNDPNAGTWVQQPTVTKSSCTLTGFTSSARIWQRVRAGRILEPVNNRPCEFPPAG